MTDHILAPSRHESASISDVEISEFCGENVDIQIDAKLQPRIVRKSFLTQSIGMRCLYPIKKDGREIFCFERFWSSFLGCGDLHKSSKVWRWPVCRPEVLRIQLHQKLRVWTYTFTPIRFLSPTGHYARDLVLSIMSRISTNVEMWRKNTENMKNEN